jgi:hypothetical protein
LTKKCRIQNPLAGISEQLLLHEVNDFAIEKGLTDILPLLKKGALVARDPSNYEDITGDEKLSEDEIEALQDEVLHKWRQPRSLYFTIVCCSIGAAVQGWDQTGTYLTALMIYAVCCRSCVVNRESEQVLSDLLIFAYEGSATQSNSHRGDTDLNNRI